MKFTATAVLATFLWTVGSFAWATQKNAFDTPSLREAKKLHDAAIDASRKEVEASENRLRELMTKEPDNQLLRAFTGSLLTIKSGKSFPGPTALRIFREGVELMNDAVDSAPDDLNVRLIRAINHYELPPFFNRRKQAREDLHWLLEKSSTPSGRAQLTASTLGAVYYYSGLALYDTGEKTRARETWRSALNLKIDSDWRIKISERLGEATAAN